MITLRNLRNPNLQLAKSIILPCHHLHCDANNAEVPHRKILTNDHLLTEENQKHVICKMQKMPPVGIKLEQKKQESTYAAVLIALIPHQDNTVSILYTRRSHRLSRHVRQISFPGGIKDPSDVDYIDCALRETEEEIGLPRNRIEIWGTGSLITPPRTAAIMPVVGVINNFDLGELKLNEHEVEEAFIIPVHKLIENNALRYTQFKSGFSSPVFVVDNYKIWGVTGFLTNNFLHCLIPTHLHRRKNHVKFIRPFKHHH